SEAAFEAVRQVSSAPDAATLQAFDGRFIPTRVLRRDGGVVVLQSEDGSLPPLIPQEVPSQGETAVVWEPELNGVRHVSGKIVMRRQEQVGVVLDDAGPPPLGSPVLGRDGVFGFVDGQEGHLCMVRPLDTLSDVLSALLF